MRRAARWTGWVPSRHSFLFLNEQFTSGVKTPWTGVKGQWKKNKRIFSIYCLCSLAAHIPPPTCPPFKDIREPLCSSAGKRQDSLPPPLLRFEKYVQDFQGWALHVWLFHWEPELAQRPCPSNPCFIGLLPWWGWWRLLLATLGHCLTECGLRHISDGHKLKQD